MIIPAVDEGVRAASRREGSAESVTNAEKWSHEAIVAFVKYATGAYAETQGCGEFWAESGV
ncbi:hypothetical protein A6769_37725 [Nostoc punctiforme NIES-2108]|uniref:Uncharacterized protein n=1 Tax=Nostoc punctiforme NIES-2108 TaxID=1356359 RepID=A0A367S0H6_NOSPU|nr:hypothetical protein A6769_37725 [Nostoc punctiforme NIES-2108]